MFELLADIALELAKFANTKEASSHADNIASIKTDLQAQLAKGQLSDDGEVERLQGQLQIATQALYDLIVSNAATKVGV